MSSRPRAPFSSNAPVLAVGLFVLGLVAAPYFGPAFHEPAVAPVIRALLVLVIIRSFGVAPRAILERDEISEPGRSGPPSRPDPGPGAVADLPSRTCSEWPSFFSRS
jgi:hypothetical protein